MDQLKICVELERQLDRAWGASTSSDGVTRFWIDPTTMAQTRLRNCMLTFDRNE